MATASLTLKSLLACTALAMTIPAQREEATLPRKKPGKVTVAYGVVIVGTHGLHELPVGNTWRMGQGNPSTLVSELPLLAGDKLLPPGGYGVNIARAGTTDLRLNVGVGGGRGGGRGGGQGGGVQFPGELSELKKKTKKLELTWLKSLPKQPAGETGGDVKATEADAQKTKGLKTCCLRLDFGPHRVDIPVTIVGATSHRARGFKALGFTYPLKLFKDRLAGGDLPVIGLIPKKPRRGQPPGFNVMVGEASVLLTPMAKAPEGRGGPGGGGRGRGGDQPKDADSEPQEIQGTVEWTPAQEPCDHVTIKAVKVVKKDLLFEIHTGDRIGKVKVAMPVTKAK